MSDTESDYANLPGLSDFEDYEIDAISISTLSTIEEEESEDSCFNESSSSRDFPPKSICTRRRSLEYEESLESLRENLEFRKHSQRDLSHLGGLQRRESFEQSKRIIEAATSRIITRRSELSLKIDLLSGLARRASFENSKLKLQNSSMDLRGRVPSKVASHMLNEKFVIENTKKTVDIGDSSYNVVLKRFKKELAAKKLRRAVASFQKRQSLFDAHQSHLHSQLSSITIQNFSSPFDKDDRKINGTKTDNTYDPIRNSVDNPQSGSFARLAAQNEKITAPSKAFTIKSPRLMQKRSRVRRALQNAEKLKFSLEMAKL